MDAGAREFEFSASNSGQGLRSEYGARGIRIVPGLAGIPGWAFELHALRLGAGEPDGVRELTSFVARGDRIDYAFSDLPGVSGWARNGESGIGIGFRVDERFAAAGERSPVLGLAFAGLAAKPAAGGGGLALLAATGDTVLHLGSPRASDGRGVELPVRLSLLPGAESYAEGVVLALEAIDPPYPVEISLEITSAVAPKASRPAGASSTGGSMTFAAEAPLAAPGNDLCTGAEPIPGDGPFPYLTSVTADVTDATTSGDPPLPSCNSNVSRSIWYEFTPSVTASYTISSCPSATATTALDTVLAVYTSSGSCGGPFVQLAGSCDDDSCGGTGFEAVSTVTLEAGIPYYVVVWQFGTAAPATGETAVQLEISRRLLTPPPNDTCAGAEAIPGSGPFPYTTSLTNSILDATTAGDPPAPSCQGSVSRSIWYEFTPAVTSNYTLATCADAPTASTVDDTVLAVYTSTGGCGGAFSQVAGYCDDDSCGVEEKQSVLSRPFMAGQTYYVVVSQLGTTPPTPGNAALQLHVSQNLAPANDACGAATALALNAPTPGTTVYALDDHQIAGASCFTGVGQISSAALGRDVAYRFTAPESGLYSFRVTNYATAPNLVLHVADGCEAASASCLGAANRANGLVLGTSNSAEEVDCLALAAGETAYAFVDENSVTNGSPFRIEVTRCEPEAPANDSPAEAGALACGVEGGITQAGEADFFALGSSLAGDRVFALVDGVAANSNDFDLRVTTTTDTLEYDDLDDDTPFGTVAPNLAGTPGPTGVAYVRLNHFSSLKTAEPYRLYAALQPSSATATAEVEPNGSLAEASAGPNHYFSGALSGSSDQDWFAFDAEAGDLLFVGLDADPLRNNTPLNAALTLYAAGGTSLVGVNDTNATSSTTSGAGSFTVKTPRSPAEGIVHRAGATGTYYVRVTGASAGDYLLSITRNCRIFPPADLGLSRTGDADPVPGVPLDYTLVVANAGPEAARNVVLRNVLRPGVLLSAAAPSQGACTGSDEVVCRLGSLAASATATVDLTVVPSGASVSVHEAAVSSDRFDPDLSDNGASCCCPSPGLDSDGDGFPDCDELCELDPAKQDPGVCGCGVPDLDSDGDGTADCLDGCPADPGKTDPGACGCGIADTDGDGDGTADCLDGCPLDPGKIAAGSCGCGVPDSDTDGDGTADCLDGCPLDPAKIAPGTCGCGAPEVPGCGLPACGDGLDNDGDGGTDYPGDAGCTGTADVSERGTAVCDDGLDNDGDGYLDYPADPACKNAVATLEKTQCQDGLDNDNATGIDFDGGASLDRDHNGFIDPLFNPAAPPVGSADPQCTAASVNAEAAPRTGGGFGCGIGPELLGVGAALAWLARRRRHLSPA